MKTLLLRLAAPLQSWGLESKFDRRSTERAPTKSGVIGLIACAMGRRRWEPVDDLNELRFGVRIDRGGVLLTDFHTAKPKTSKNPYVTYRYYLSDAVFLVGLEGEEALLNEVEAALKSPVFPMYLGRRSCPPEGRLIIGMREAALEDALNSEPRLAAAEKNGLRGMRVMIEDRQGSTGVYLLRDKPESFARTHRKYGFRRVREYTVYAEQNGDGDTRANSTSHDPMAELEV